MTEGEPAPIDLETIRHLVDQSEIDFGELKAQVRELLEHSLQVSIAEVLEAFPPRQGLGSVLGLIALASRHGLPGTGRQVATWTGTDGVGHRAGFPMLYFLQENRHALW